jgi:Abnormal spindle-like microcephaly-assoc'd, ASPM-SPD-2-Hydin
MTKLIAAAAFVLAVLVAPASALAAPSPEGGDPVLAISPAPAVLPTTTVGNQSQAVELQLHNEGSEEAAIEKVWLQGEDMSEFSLSSTDCGGTTLMPGQSCSAWVTLKANSVGLKKTTLQISFQAGRPEQGFEVSGGSVAPQLTFSPPSHAFGLQRVYETRNHYLQVVNSGEATVQLNSFEVNGGSGSFWTGNSDCFSHPLEPGQGCNVEVSFSPQDAVPYAAELRVVANGFTAALSGEGGRAVIEATPNPADFGPLTVGTTGPAQTITITNSGNIPAGFFIGIVAGGDSGSFQLLDENCTGGELMPAATCTAHVRFRPQDAGPKAAYMAFFGDSDGGAMVGLKGEGVAPAATLTPGSFDFGSYAAASRSDVHSFAVSNDGSTPLDLNGVTISGADLDQFALAGDECTGETLAPGAECLVRVRFTPDSAGAKAAKLRVGSGAGAFVATLAGTATPALAATVTAAAHHSHRVHHHGSAARTSRRRHLIRGESLVSRGHRMHLRANVISR